MEPTEINYPEIIQKSNTLVFSKNDFSATQLNIMYRCISLITVSPEELQDDRIYPIEFQRSDIPRVNETEYLIQELKDLQDLKVTNVSPLDSNCIWESIVPFPKMGEYKNGIIKVWLLGEYIRELSNKRKGFALIDIIEGYKLQGTHPKNLFDMFCGYKYRKCTRYIEEANILMQLIGAGPSYKYRPKQFYEAVIIPAIKQINEKTSITVRSAYKRGTKREKARFIFEIDIKKEQQELPRQEPESSNELPEKEYNPNYEDERQVRCYERMTDWGFTPKQARNCAENEKTMSLFFKWKADSGIDSHIRSGKITKEEAKKMFFGELKKNSLRI